MSIKDLVYKNRTYRRFDQSHKVPMSVLEELVDLARVTSSGGNIQAIKFVLVTDEQMCQTVNDHIFWAGALPDWPGPAEGEKPTAYIITLRDNNISKNTLWDLGLATEAMLLGAVEKGLGACQFGSVKYAELSKVLELPETLVITSVLALGKPVEKVVLVDIPESGKTTYYRDENMVHYVPKRKMEDIILKKF
ncbi:MAG: nitroreductase family protein [Eubacteriaceae bacterium]|jgi:nitroreductase|nr:nitroreductase family protein [Eubacteriaceae bacterium]